MYEPPFLELFLTKLAFLLFGRRVYGDFANRLPLKGAQRVLDFGCGMGTTALFAAKRLPNGSLTCADSSKRWLKACRKTVRRFQNVSFLLTGESRLPADFFDVAYCHFVLHDIGEGALEDAILALAGSLKSGGALVFREPLRETKKLGIIKGLMEGAGLSLKASRVTDVPLMGNALECVYVKR